MRKSDLIEPVFVGKVNMLYRAAALLTEHGIRSRHSSPRRAEGILRVSRVDAAAARRLLLQLDANGIVSAQEAAHFFCSRCETYLSLGTTRCPRCDEFVGDPHAT